MKEYSKDSFRTDYTLFKRKPRQDGFSISYLNQAKNNGPYYLKTSRETV